MTSEQRERLQAMVDGGQQTWDLSPNDVDAIQAVLAELDHLQAIVVRIPAELFTADGVPCFGGEEVYIGEIGELARVNARGEVKDCSGDIWCLSECYSTPEAAREANK
jgi:hypothetical protein